MLELQEFLCIYGMEAFKKAYPNINVKRHNTLPLTQFSYRYIHDIHDEIQLTCRGIILDDDLKIVARPFKKFFNLNENIEQQKDFNWDKFKTIEKEDGTLIILYYYDNSWMIATTGSFGDGPVGSHDMNWEDLFYSIIPNESSLDGLDKTKTYLFELCTQYNRVVVKYNTDTINLIGCIDNVSGEELEYEKLQNIAFMLEVSYPVQYHLLTLKEIQDYIDHFHYLDFEGFVLVDDKFNRIKIKSKKYVQIHNLLFNQKEKSKFKILLSLLIEEKHDDISELVCYYPELGDLVELAKQHLLCLNTILYDNWQFLKSIEERKNFYEIAVDINPNFHNLLLHMRGTNGDIVSAIKTYKAYIIKKLFEGFNDQDS